MVSADLSRKCMNSNTGLPFFEVVLDDGNEEICDHGNVNLYAHSILGFFSNRYV